MLRAVYDQPIKALVPGSFLHEKTRWQRQLFFIFMLVSCFASRTQGACACLYAIVLGSPVKSVELNLGREKT